MTTSSACRTSRGRPTKSPEALDQEMTCQKPCNNEGGEGRGTRVERDVWLSRARAASCQEAQRLRACALTRLVLFSDEFAGGRAEPIFAVLEAFVAHELARGEWLRPHMYGAKCNGRCCAGRGRRGWGSRRRKITRHQQQSSQPRHCVSEMLSRFRIAARSLATMQTRVMEITNDSRRFQQFKFNQRENRLDWKALYSAELKAASAVSYLEPMLYPSS